MTNTNHHSLGARDSRPASGAMGETSVRSLAHGIFEKLQSQGCNTKDIISVSSHLISLITVELQKTGTPS